MNQSFNPILMKFPGRWKSRNSHGGGMLVAVVGVAVVALGLFLAGWFPRMENSKELQRMEATTSGAVPVLHTAKAESAAFEESGTLPGNIGAVQYANIYSRVDGYLKERMVDIGSVVKKGQVLAEIDTPTLDEELAQSLADLAEARAQLKSAQSQLKQAKAQLLASQAQVEKSQADEDYASITAKRWVTMADKGAVSLQSRDEKVKSYDAQTATLKTAKAEEQVSESAVSTAEAQVLMAKSEVVAKEAGVRKWQAQHSFKRVVAPFDGVITLRKVDPGALITSGSMSSSLQLFQLAKTDILRIYINVPQTIARYVYPGQAAEVTVPEFPGRGFEGKIANVSGALDPNTRTRQVEIRLDNRDNTLLPGMYAQVKITVRRDDPWLKIPSTALVPKNDGMYVVTVKGDKAHYQKVEIGRDFGDQIEVSFGLHKDDVVALSPPVDLKEGETVKPEPTETK